MGKKTEVTEFKTKRINQFTGGEIDDYILPNYPVSKLDDGILQDAFVSKSGQYIGDYNRGWNYFKNNMVVCREYANGVAIVLNLPANKIENFDAKNINTKHIKGYRGYTHRGGQIFTIGDKLFDEKYKPKESDFSKKEWKSFMVSREKSIKEGLKDGWYKTKAEGLKESPISDFIPFVKRGSKIIKNWNDAKKAAINMSQYLS